MIILSLNDLNWNALISRACDVGECIVMRWEAYRIALERFDWFYRANTNESYWRDHEHKYIMLITTRSMLTRLDYKRSIKLWDYAAWGI